MLSTYEPHLHALVLDSLSDGVITVDEEGAITSFNRAAERLTGWSRAEVLGRALHRSAGNGSGRRRLFSGRDAPNRARGR
jgi:PAS domain S-box-containing protein